VEKIKYFQILLLFFSLILNSACSDDDPDVEPELITSLQELSFSKEGEAKIFYIKSNTEWNVVASEPWCELTPSSGEAGTVKVTAAVLENTTSDARSASITVSSGSLSKQIAITQSGGSTLVISQNKFDVSANSGQVTIELQASGDYEVTVDQNWITKTGGTTGQSEIFTIAVNPGLMEREGSITFTLDDLTETVVIIQSGQDLNIPADQEGMEDDAMALAAKMKVGWNIGNTLESCNSTTASETLWGNPKVTKALIDAVKSAGFNAARIPCAWTGYIEDAETDKIKDSWLARVKEVVDYCMDNDMYAIINIHWDGGWLEENPTYDKQEKVNKKQKALWEQIAVYFRDYDEHLLFAGTNEVHADYGTPTTENLTVQMSFNQTFVDAVRSTGGRNTYRELIVQAYNTNIQYANDYLEMPDDDTPDRLMAEVHFYDPYDFTLQEDNGYKTRWGKDFTDVSSWGQEDWVDEAFGYMKSKFVNNRVPVILGEYGAILRSSLSSGLEEHIEARNYYLNYVTKTAVADGLIPFYWDNGNTGNNGFGLFNRSTAAVVYQDAIDAIMSGAGGN